MLIQITNKCHEGCAHCMQCSNPHGEHMDMTTFKNALRFARFLGVSSYIITGGEPTEHPQFYEFCEALNRFIKGSKVVGGFSITSNGTWFPERKAERRNLQNLTIMLVCKSIPTLSGIKTRHSYLSIKMKLMPSPKSLLTPMKFRVCKT